MQIPNPDSLEKADLLELSAILQTISEYCEIKANIITLKVMDQDATKEIEELNRQYAILPKEYQWKGK